MAERNIDAKLKSYLRDAHAMETNVQQMLTAMIATTQDPSIRQVFERHQRETEQQIERLTARLQARGEGSSVVKDAGAIMAAFFKGLGDIARSDKAGKNARDAYVTESLEIASYELLERLAERSGDRETAEVARTNRAEEEAMRDVIASNWDRFVDLVVGEEGATPA